MALQENRKDVDLYRTQLEHSLEDALLAVMPNDPQTAVDATNLCTELNVAHEQPT